MALFVFSVLDQQLDIAELYRDVAELFGEVLLVRLQLGSLLLELESGVLVCLRVSGMYGDSRM